MNRFFKIVRNNNKNIFFIVFLVTLFSSASVFAQKSNVESSTDVIAMNDNSNTVDTTPTKVTTSSVSNSNVNFILWFMGTKEDINKTFSDDMYSKKSILTSGREPNHLLIKTLLKKAINIKSC